MEKPKNAQSLSLSELFRAFEKHLGFKNDVKWTTAILLFVYHIGAIYWCALYAFPVKFQTIVYALVMYIYTGFGITGGAHRLWTHKAYKAKLPLKLFLLIGFASAGQNSLEQWVRDHRVHHKYSDTKADPHDSNRGLFFSHIGWLMMKKNSHVLTRGKQMDMSDITDDSLPF
nr:delta(9)-fatty-acid desaturase fat-6-like [Vanessa tameamea]